MKFRQSVRIILGLSAAVCGSAPLTADEQPQRAPGREPGVSQEAKLDLNTADVKTLEAVPVIGPTVARAIVAARPFKTIHDLDRVPGIPAEQLEQIRAKVTVLPSHTPRKLGMPASAAADPSPNRDRRRIVNLNTADPKELESIPGVEPQSARAILAARPFASLDDLSRVKGLSAEQLEIIRANVTVTDAESGARKRK